MNFSDFVIHDAIETSLKSSSKEDVLAEMAAKLVAAGAIPADSQEEVVAALKRREELGSTGIGKGVAVPHAKHACVEQPTGMVALCDGDGIPFDALDGANVNVFFLVISPPDRPGEHLRALEYITQSIRDEEFLRFLKQSASREDVLELLKEQDAKVKA